MEKILSLKDRIHGIQTSVALENNRELDFNPDSSIYTSGNCTSSKEARFEDFSIQTYFFG